MAKTAKNSERDEGAVRALVVPLAGINLLVPNTVVAEVIPYGEPAPLPEAVPWMAGMVQWRGLKVPLFAFEVFVGLASEPPAGANRLVIINTLRGNERLPFIAVASQGIPRALRVSEQAVQQSAPAPEPGLAYRLAVDEVALAIPELDAIEDALIQGGITVERDA